MKYIKLFESFDGYSDDEILKQIANELSVTMHCDRFGACVHFAEEFVLVIALLIEYVNSNNKDEEKFKILTKNFHTTLETIKDKQINTDLLNTFSVIEGYVDWQHGEGIPQQHTWIELESGDKIDPTYIQFTKYGRASYSRMIKSKVTGLEYYNETIEGTWFTERRKKYPEMFFKKL